NGWKSIRSTATAGNVTTYTLLPAIGTYFAYNQANKPLEKGLGASQNEYNTIAQELQRTRSLLGLLRSDIRSLTTSQPGLLDKLGSVGVVLGGALTAYRYLQTGLHEYVS